MWLFKNQCFRGMYCCSMLGLLVTANVLSSLILTLRTGQYVPLTRPFLQESQDVSSQKTMLHHVCLPTCLNSVTGPILINWMRKLCQQSQYCTVWKLEVISK
jgi:hypothetical protein